MTSPQSQASRLKEGKRLFNAGQFFEAHEIWEEAWKDCGKSGKITIQGLIQAAAGFHKLKLKSPEGSVKLLNLASEKLAQAAEFKSLADHISICAAAIQAGNFDPKQIPKLNLQSIK